jgi:hypothetical protein
VQLLILNHLLQALVCVTQKASDKETREELTAALEKTVISRDNAVATAFVVRGRET